MATGTALRFAGLCATAVIAAAGRRVFARRDTDQQGLIEDVTRVRTVLAALPLGVALVDRHGRTLVANPIFRRMIPFARSRSCGERDDGALARKSHVIARALKGELVWPGEELKLCDPERGAVWMQLGAAPMVNGAGQIAGATVVLIDIEAQKRSEAALAEQQRIYKSVTDNATTALFIMDQSQQCVFMNPAAEAMTGFRLAETRGRPLHDLVHHTRPDGRPYPLSECPIDQAFPRNDRELCVVRLFGTVERFF